ncbi:zinc ribbon domain-containing protein [Paenibacillus sp. Pae108]|uniref:zinc ribbon domain-containing protein n=1 Tax=Paenibacillus sp. Pae108 TaxID=2926019 RepID=UPI0021177988|nr:zinc ribbon domain-containing protein [Paenibacillus sp. Pae108]
MDLYICPVCKNKNTADQKYCGSCGTWLLSERFPAQKAKKQSFDKLYICSFCDTANEPGRNACKKCFKPLFSNEYETKEISVKKRGGCLIKLVKVTAWTVTVLVGLFIFIGVIANQDETKTTSGTATGSKQVQQDSIGTSRNNPAPIGTQITSRFTQLNENFEASVTVTKVIRGDEAWKLISKSNQFNPPPKADHEYMLAEIALTVNKSDKPDTQLSLGPFNFTLVSTDGKDYEFTSLVLPDPSIQTKLYAGATHTGWAGFIVRKDDPTPLIATARDAQGRNGIWFKTN